jgi:uncharacterized damage-inducible protein DinB
MITPAYARMMAAYNAEMNRRTYATAAGLTDAERRADHRAFWGSIHGTLSHILWGDRIWMSRFAGWPKPTQEMRDSPALHENFDQLRAAREVADSGIIAWAEGLDQAWLDQDLVWYSGVLQSEVRRPRVVVVTHFFNHQAHHRGQVHAMLTAHGRDTGDTDLPIVLRDLERAGRAPS